MFSLLADFGEQKVDETAQARFPGLYFPMGVTAEVVAELTTPHVLVQEFIEGRPFATLYDADQATRDRIAEIIFRYAFGSIYRYRLFNGDPHPGNYLVTRLDVDAVFDERRFVRGVHAADPVEAQVEQHLLDVWFVF